MKKAFIFYGGWEGHEPEKESARFQRWLEEENYQVTRVDTLDRLADAEYMKTFDLIVPCWTQGTLPDPCCFGVSDAVAAGTGLAGVHGGMCDSFRWSVEWQYMTGSQWVSPSRRSLPASYVRPVRGKYSVHGGPLPGKLQTRCLLAALHGKLQEEFFFPHYCRYPGL